MIKALIFDFDGVILESADIKTDAFRKLFTSASTEKLNEIINYHINNMGISRYIKFKHIYNDILKLPLTAEKEEELGREFTLIVLNEVLVAPFVPGVIDFLNKNQKLFMMFIASGTPEEELRYIVKKRELGQYFREIHGTPKDKASIIADIMHRYRWKPNEIVFVGDAESDWKASEKTGVKFIARIHEGGNMLFNCNHKINDFYELKQLLFSI